MLIAQEVNDFQHLVCLAWPTIRSDSQGYTEHESSSEPGNNTSSYNVFTVISIQMYQLMLHLK